MAILCSRAGTRGTVPNWCRRGYKIPLRACLDARVSTPIHMCWSVMEWNLVQLHSNPLQHIWIEMNTCTSKQTLSWDIYTTKLN